MLIHGAQNKRTKTMSDFDQSTIDSMFGAISSPVGFGSGYKKNPLIYSFEKKKARTLQNGSKVNSVRGRLMAIPVSKGLPSFFVTRTHSVKYGNNKNYIQICGKAFGEPCAPCEWISNVWESSRASGVPAPKADAHKAGKLSINKDLPGDVWMNFYVYEDLQTPENNNKMFVYRLPAKLRDLYNAAISGGQDPMGRPLEAYDPAHPLNGCDIEIYAVYTDSKTEYTAQLLPRSQMFNGNMEYILRAADLTHDIKTVVKEDAQLEKAKAGLEFFLRSYQPNPMGQAPGQHGSPAGLFTGGQGGGNGGFFGGNAPPPPPMFEHGAPVAAPAAAAAAAPYSPGNAFSQSQLPAAAHHAPPPPAPQYVVPAAPAAPVAPSAPAPQYAPSQAPIQQSFQASTPPQQHFQQDPSIQKPKTAFDDLDLLGN